MTGCADNSCVVAKPSGMATNGGCRCDARTLRRALALARSDVVAAAGEVRVPIPAPGTDAAKMLIANRLLHGEIGSMRNQRDEQEAENAKLRDALLKSRRALIVAYRHAGDGLALQAELRKRGLS